MAAKKKGRAMMHIAPLRLPDWFFLDALICIPCVVNNACDFICARGGAVNMPIGLYIGLICIDPVKLLHHVSVHG